jgi:hypothetical protein
LRTVAASPVKLTLLTGGSALITLAYIGGLVASVQAFGGHAGIAEIGAVYLGAAVIAAASPTPGGLGAIEAALVAGLTGIGMPPGPAVSAVLAYRLATYWLPVLPGWLCLRFLQNRQYIRCPASKIRVKGLEDGTQGAQRPIHRRQARKGPRRPRRRGVAGGQHLRWPSAG